MVPAPVMTMETGVGAAHIYSDMTNPSSAFGSLTGGLIPQNHLNKSGASDRDSGRR